MTCCDAPSEGAAEAPRRGRVDYLASIGLLLGHSRGVRGRLLASVLLSILSVMLELVPVLAVWRLITAVTEGEATLALFLGWSGAALLAVLAGYLALGAAMSAAHLAAFGIVHNLRLALARHLAGLPLGWFSACSSGEAKKLIVDEPERLELVAAHAIPEGSGAIATFLAVTAWLFAVDWRMALASVVLTPLSFLLMGWGMARSSRHVGAYQQASARMNAAVVEYLAAMPVVKIFSDTGQSFAGTAQAVRDYTRIELDMGRAFIPFGGAFNALVMSNVTVILPTGLFLLMAGQVGLADLVFFLLLGSGYSQPLMKLFNLFHQLAHVSIASTVIRDVLDTPPQAQGARRARLSGHDVAFKDVRFAYGAREVLRGVSLTARAGTVTALVGASGSGKSTLASLLPRIHDPSAGRIRIGGADVRDMPLAQLMDEVAFVFQDTFLFADTIAANIRCGRPGTSDAEVAEAARAACADGFIRALPDGYASRVGDAGVRLSGGERQRLAIARAILKDAPIIVLDEATAFADPDSEAAIQEAIGRLAAGKTLLVVAHRLNTIVEADQICVMREGEIIERGRHRELLARGGAYARLWADHVEAEATTLRADGTPVESAP